MKLRSIACILAGISVFGTITDLRAQTIRITSAVGNAPSSQEADRIVRRLWRALPDHGVNAYTLSGLTADFYYLVEEGFSMPSTDPGGIGEEEIMWYWYTAQDASVDDDIKSIRYVELTDDMINAKVTYVNLGTESEHDIVIIKEDGTWKIDDFDDMKEPIREFVDTWREKYINGEAENIIRANSESMLAADVARYREEVETYLRLFGDRDEEVGEQGNVNQEGTQVVVIAPPVIGEKEPEPEPEPIFIAVEAEASFPGGTAALMKWLSNNLRYPESAQENEIQGRVIVRFVINKDGSIEQASVVKGVDKELDAEALRVVKMMPKWQPAKNGGIAVRCYFTLPVTFKLGSVEVKQK